MSASMLAVPCFGRLSARHPSQAPRRYLFFFRHRVRQRHDFHSTFARFHRTKWRSSSSTHPPHPGHGRKLLLAASVSGGAAAALTPTALAAISSEHETSNDPNNKTGEQLMLQASQREIEAEDNQLPKFLTGGHYRTLRAIYIFVDTYIVEPLATGLRFLHLVIIFTPVALTTPIVLFGRRIEERDNERSGTLWWYNFLVRSMERAGAAFIKLGQWAASRTDIFPDEMCAVMSSLHSNVPAHSLARTKRIVRAAFGGRRFEEIFEEFDEKPLGVGAIAQVYRAKLKPDLAALSDSDVEKTSMKRRVKKNVDALAKHTPQRVPSSHVAIKVLHPGVDRIVRRDLRIMSFFANIINAIPTMEWLSFPDEVTQFGEMMNLQLDLRIESANLTMFRKHFKDRTTAWFPFPYNEFTTRQVLVEEFAHGIPLADFLENGGGVFQKEIADEGLDAFLHMLLIDNFTHADLHPGNIMVRFYKPARVQVPTYVDVFSRTRGTQQGAFPSSKDTQTIATPRAPNDDDDEDYPTVDESDVTEQVLAQLRPHKNDKKAWGEVLDKIDQNGFRPQLVLIDTGLVTELNNVNRTNFLDLFKAVAEFDGYKAGHLMVERCRQPEAVINREVFALRMQHLVLGVKSKTFALGNIKIGDVLSEVLDMVRSHHVRLEGDFVNVVLSILLLEGIGRTLDPDLDLFAGALPILRRLGTQGGAGMVRSGDFSMIKVWAGLEARKLINISVEEVERCVKYDQLSPNV